MTREEQERIFVEEIDKTLNRLADEFDLSTYFVVGALEAILLDIKLELREAVIGESEDE